MDERGLGTRLQAARKQAGLTQQELCGRANLSFSTLTKIERGAIKAPSIFTVQAIAGALGLGLEALLGETSPAPPSRNLLITKSGVRFIYFDVNGVLIHFFERAFTGLAKATGAQPDVVETAYLHYNDDVCRGMISLSDFNEKLAERLQVKEIDWQKYYLDAVEPITQMQELLIWTSQRYKVGLMTNIMPGLVSTMRRTEQLPNIAYDAVVDSSEIAAIKPEEKIFEIAQQRAGCPPEQILLIDDSRPNLMAAEQYGWNALGFDDARTEESAERVRQALEPASN